MSFWSSRRIERYNRGAGELTDIANNNWTTSEGTSGVTVSEPSNGQQPRCPGTFHAEALPGEPGNWLIPNENATGSPNVFSPYNAFLPGTATFISDQVVGNISTGICQRQGHVAVKYSTSTIPAPRHTLIPTCPDSRRTWTPVLRWSRLTTCRPSVEP
jgi:hypothetical protein